MSEEMIEKVATALSDSAEAAWNEHKIRDDWRSLARAALSAYNPDERLREALEDACGKAKLAADALGNSGHIFASVREGFRIIERVCDSALSPLPQGEVTAQRLADAGLLGAALSPPKGSR